MLLPHVIPQQQQRVVAVESLGYKAHGSLQECRRKMRESSCCFRIALFSLFYHSIFLTTSEGEGQEMRKDE